MSENMTKHKTLSNLMWRFFERCGAQGVGFIVSIILARLLTPEIYGEVAIISIFVNILNVFADSGFGTALIQKKDADDLDFSTVFYFNSVLCVVLYLILFFVSPLIAYFYENANLTVYLRAMGLTLIVSAVRNVQQAYVSKQLIFKKFFIVTLSSTVVSAIIGISAAYMGLGVWALILQNLSSSIMSIFVLCIIVEWRPKLMFSFARLKGLFSFGWKLLTSSLLTTLYNDLRQLIIGKKYTSSDLAFYNKANQFPQMIVNNINASIDSVLLPTMSSVQENKTAVKAMTRRSIKTSTYIMAPLMIGLAVCAKPVILLLLTEKWLPSVPYLQIFCITYLFYPIHTANLNAIKAVGRSDLFLKMEILKVIIGIIFLVVSMWFGVLVMAYSLLITTFISTIINAFPNKKLLNYSWFEQMKDILPNIGLATLMGLSVFFLQYLPIPTVVILILQVSIGAGVYIGLSAILKLEIFRYIIGLLNNIIKK